MVVFVRKFKGYVDSLENHVSLINTNKLTKRFIRIIKKTSKSNNEYLEITKIWMIMSFMTKENSSLTSKMSKTTMSLTQYWPKSNVCNCRQTYWKGESSLLIIKYMIQLCRVSQYPTFLSIFRTIIKWL